MLIASLFRLLARRASFVFPALVAAAAALAQTPSAFDGFDPNVDGNVYVLATQPDGKILVGGQFANFRTRDAFSISRNNIARLNTDGTVDPTFNPNANGAVHALVLQPDGKIVIGGEFTSLQPGATGTAVTRNRIARLNADGTVDTTFSPSVTGPALPGGGTLAAQVNALVLQADGAIIAGGAFASAQDSGGGATVTRRNIARFTPAGVVDKTYDPNPNAVVNALALHLDGKIVVGGGFTTLQENGKSTPTVRQYIARLNPNGTVDSEFDPKADNGVTTIAIQRDGKVVFGGFFMNVQPIGNDSPASRQHIARLNANGTLDSEFYPIANGTVYALAVMPDGGLLMGGAFSEAWSRGSGTLLRGNVARFLPDGSLDPAFNPNVNAEVDAFSFQLDGKMVVGGKFTRAQPPGAPVALVRNRMARLNPDGSVDTDFQLDPGGRVLVSVQQSDGKVVIGGTFTNVGGVTHNYLARLNADGSVDNTYNPNLDGRVLAMIYEPSSNKVIVGGSFINVGTDSRPYIARINANGTVDSEFNVKLDAQVGALLEQSDGKILVGGAFTTVQPFGTNTATVRDHIMRLNNNGSIDTGFHPNANASVSAIALQSDGKVLVAGSFTAFTPDADLTPIVTTTTATTTPSDKESTTSSTSGNTTTTTVVTIAGNVTTTTKTVTTSGTTEARSYLGRLNTDGTLDTNFKPTISNLVSRVVVQSDGKIIIGGSFTTVVGSDGTLVTTTNPDGTKASSAPIRNHIARLTTDGNLDAYDPNANGTVLAMALQSDGKLVIGGTFLQLQPNGATDWTLRKYAARLNTDGTVDPNFNLDINEQTGNRVDSITIQNDGRILIGGTFLSLQPRGTAARYPRNGFARINADGTLDTSFDPGATGSAAGTINAFAVQTNGKVIAVGSFSDLGNAKTQNIARFNAEGTADPTFSPTIGTDGPVNAVVLRPSGAAIASQLGGFAWLNRDGTLRTTFASGAARISGTIDAIAVQPDGNVLLGGAFSNLDNTTNGNLIRVSPAGVIDTNFNPSPVGSVLAITLQSDGKIIIAGGFTAIGSTTRNHIARLNADGSLDTAFDPNANSAVRSVVLQSDGMIVIGGDFTTITPNGSTTTTVTTTTTTPNAGSSTNTVTNADGSVTTTTISTVNGTTTTTVTTTTGTATTRNYIARLKADGTVDTSYDPNLNAFVNSLTIEPDGKVIAGGSFTQVQPNGGATSFPRNYIARFNLDGTVDQNWDPHPDGIVNVVVAQPNSQILVGGGFSTLSPSASGGNGTTRYNIARVNSDGAVDPNFNPNANAAVTAIALQSDNSILLGGIFTTLQPNGAAAAVTRKGVARIGADGSLDFTFNPDLDNVVKAIVARPDGSVLLGGLFTQLQPAGPIIIGGSFASIGGVPTANIAMLNDDGSVNNTFTPNPNGVVTALLAQPDGKMLAGGAFTRIAGATRSGLARFNADGTLDTAFSPTISLNPTDLALQPDGKILVVSNGGLVRLLPNGAPDNAFTNPVAGGSTTLVRRIALQSSGKIVYAFGSALSTTIGRLNADGTVDSSFTNVPITGGDTLRALTVQTDGRIIIGGVLGGLAGHANTTVARLNANGGVDTSFDPQPNSTVTALALQTDGRLILGGNFATVGGAQRVGIARVTATGAATQAMTVSADRRTVTWSRAGTAGELAAVRFEISSDRDTWTLLGYGSRVTGTSNWTLSGLSLPASGLFYVRGLGIAPTSGGGSSGLYEIVREFNFTSPLAIPTTATFADTTAGGPPSTAAAVAYVTEPASGITPLATSRMVNGDTVEIVAAAMTQSAASTNARLANLSTRARINGANPLLVGFAINGTGSRTVLLRAIGPALQAFGVTDALAATRLQVYDSTGKPLQSNEGWNSADIGSAFAQAGAFPLAANSGDSAAVATLAPGNYTLQVVDTRGSGGVALGEIYDLGGSAGARLTNVSSRGIAGSGSGVLLSGFVIAGDAPKRVLLRGIGPGLAQFGVTSAAANPAVSLYDSAGRLLGTNDNWVSITSDLAVAAAQSGAFALTAGSQDAAVLATLAPGAYTVQVSNADASASGSSALLEIYDTP